GAVGTTVDPALRHLEPVIALIHGQLRRAEQGAIRHRPDGADAIVGDAETVGLDALLIEALPARRLLRTIGGEAGAGAQGQGRNCDQAECQAFHTKSPARLAPSKARCSAAKLNRS